MVSSTARDLPDHRQHVLDACLRQSFEPIMMEHLAALDADAIKASLQMVDEADIYLGVFAYRYGWVPGFDNPRDISVTEMEYRRAVERGIPRLIFFMHDEHPVRGSDVEKGEGAVKLQKLKDEIGSQRVAGFFKSPEELRSLVIDSLSKLPQTSAEQKRATEFHYISPIPRAPEVYVAHPYTLLTTRTGELIGRQQELKWLSDWVAGTRYAADSLPNAQHPAMSRMVERLHRSTMFFLVAIGGQGKSALAWHWFQHIAEQEMKPRSSSSSPASQSSHKSHQLATGLAGRLWWSFYESDASFENFVIRALAYTANISIEQAAARPAADREAWLLHLLDTRPFLCVLDGVERLLLAYSGGSGRGLEDSDLDQRTAHRVAEAMGLDETAAQSYTGQARLRLTSDPRAGAFLRKLTQVRASRVLATTRLYPSDLQIEALGEPVAACFAYFLPGLCDDDALTLWREFGAKGARESVLPVLESFGKHSLLVQALASEVAKDRAARGDFEHWQQAHPDFNPFALAHDQRRSHVLRYALAGLSEQHLWLLQTIAAFRMPTTFATLLELWGRAHCGRVAPQLGAESRSDSATTSLDLDAALTELEDRGLVGWDRRGNRYDLHPIVRGVVWNALNTEQRQSVCQTLQTHFQPIEVPHYRNVTSIADLTPAIELFHALIELGRYDDACNAFYNRLDYATLWRLSASRLRIELVERLFPDGTDQLPRLSTPSDQSYSLNALAAAYHFNGQPGAAVPLFRRNCDLNEQANDTANRSVGLGNLSNAERLAGAVRSAEASARLALRLSRDLRNAFQEATSLQWLGLALAVRGVASEASRALAISQQLFEKQDHRQCVGLICAFNAEVALWSGAAATARTLADRAWELAAVDKHEADFIRAARLQGTAALRSLECSGSTEPSDVSGTATPNGPAPSSPKTTSSGPNRIPAKAASGDQAHAGDQSCAAENGGLRQAGALQGATIEFAHERLHHALTRARACDRVEEELPTLIALAELHETLAVGHVFNVPVPETHPGTLETCPTNVTDGDETSRLSATLGSPLPQRETETLATSLRLTPDEHLVQAERLLDDVWDRCERGPYPLFHADALNRLASIQRLRATFLTPNSAEHRAALAQAGEAAINAYQKAWCDGPPYAYAYGLAQAEQHVAALGLPFPNMPPFDASKFPPMPDVPIEPESKS